MEGVQPHGEADDINRQPDSPEQGGQIDEARRERIAVWIGALGAYNAGILHGEWADADVHPGELWESINGILDASPVPGEEEFAFFDYDGFEGIRIGEYDSVERVTALGRFVREYGQAGAAFYSNDPSIELDDLHEAFSEAYIGEYDTEYEAAEALAAEAIDLVKPEWARSYFDTERYFIDLTCGGDIYVVKRKPYGVYVFRSV